MKIKFTLLLFIVSSVIRYADSYCSTSDTTVAFPDISGWNRAEIKSYNSANLYTPIDGAADLFLRYNFEEMQATEYTCDSNYITVEVYRHKTPTDAFGIYSQEKPDKNIYFNIGVQGYKEDDYLNFLAGRFYLKIRVWKVNEKSLKVMNDLASQLAQSLNNKAIFPVIFAAFPSEGRIPFSEKYISRDVLGYNFLHSSFQIEYKKDEKLFTVFVLKGSNGEDALGMLRSYFKYLKQPTDDMSDGLYQVVDKHNGVITVLKSDKYLLCIRGNSSMEDNIKILNEIKIRIEQLKTE